MTEEETLVLNFRETLDLPQDAIDWLLAVWNFIQVMDDVADGDDVDRDGLYKAISDGLFGFSLNSFFDRHKAWLIPALSLSLAKWHASDFAERNGLADERSFMWRAGYYDLVCLVATIVHGPDRSMAYSALALYGETYAEYQEEFGNA